MPEPNDAIEPKIEYKLISAKEAEEDQENLYEYQSKIKLTPDQETELIGIIEANLDLIEKQRSTDGCETRWEEYDNQYWGIVQENSNTLFNLHQFLTLSRVRRVKSRLYQAFLESDPIFSISPRPGYAKKDGYEDAERQEQFLDYEFDSEIIIEGPFKKSLHEACLKDGGVLKLIWERDFEWMRQKETYEGTTKGLKSFLEVYPDARERYPHFVEKLEAGEDIDIVVDKREIVYDAPRFYYVPFKNFYIDLTTEGLLGLRKSKFHAELQTYNWYELQEEVEEERFDKEKVENLRWITDEDGKPAISLTYLEQPYDVFECNLFYDLKKNGKPKRIVIWYARERRTILNTIHFPYQHARPYYIPFFIIEEMPGWHQPGLGRVLQPSNIIANSTTNFLLDNAFYRNTPLIRATPNSPIAQQLLAKTWKIGDPLVAERGEVEPFSLQTGNLTELITLLKMNDYAADDASGAPSGYLSGRADPTDPDAPAQKTMMLLKESNLNIKDFILCLVPSFQEMAYQILQLFAQFKGTAKYKLKYAVGEEKAFEITPEQLRLRTNVTPMATTFAFDKLNEKRENLALTTSLTTNPMAQKFLANAPQAQWRLFHILIKSWSDKWNQKVDEVFPSLEKVEEYLVEIQKKAFNEFYEQKIKEFQQKGGRLPMTREEMRPPTEGAGFMPGGAPPEEAPEAIP